MIKLPETLQEVFDIVSNHLLTQGKMSVGIDGFCAYRGENGMKCAAGVLIPDDQYKPAMEGIRWVYLVNRGLIENKFKHEIGELQNIHDISPKDDLKECNSLWKRELITFAAMHNLTHTIEV